MKAILWLIAVMASGAAGMYVGFDYGLKTGGETMSFIAAQVAIPEDISLVRTSIDALGQGDLEHAIKMHEKNLRSALFRIDAYSRNKSGLPCYKADRETMDAARKYIDAHPAILNDAEQKRGLQFCLQQDAGA